MSEAEVVPAIPESIFEHKVQFSSHWISDWGAPNPFISLLYDGLGKWGITLSDFSFADGKNVGDVNLAVAIKRLRAIVRVGLDYVSIFAQNPDWEDAEELIALSEETLRLVISRVKIPVQRQESTIAFHVLLGKERLRESTAMLVNPTLVRDATGFGVSVYERDHSFQVERSVRYSDAAFIRISRTFAAEDDFTSVAEALYRDEKRVLDFMKIEGVV